MPENSNFNTYQAKNYLSKKGTPFTEKTLQAWRSLGRGPRFKRVGGRVFYEKSALDEFIRGRTSDE